MFPIVFLLAAGEILTKLTTTREKVLAERKIFVKQCDLVLVSAAGNEDRGQRAGQGDPSQCHYVLM